MSNSCKTIYRSKKESVLNYLSLNSRSPCVKKAEQILQERVLLS